jgi:hypothetical protein
MHLIIDKQRLAIELQVHSQQQVAIPLPGKQGQWQPNQVMVNGKHAQAIIKINDTLWLELKQGIHHIELLGLNPAHNKFSLAFPLKPHRTTVDNKGWNIEGVYENGRIDNQLIFNRIKTAQNLNEVQKLEPNILPAFIRIERTLHLGLDWRITTKIVRVYNNVAALSLKFPLLPEESVTSSGIRVKNKHVQVNMSSKQNSFQWQSVLKKTSQIDLLAAKTHLWTELWRADVSPIWHLQTSGIAVVHHQDQGRWLPEWRPWPGEKVSLKISRPEALKGATLTIDKTELTLTPEKRSMENELNFIVRSTKGTQHSLHLPEQITLQSVRINGVTQAIRLKDSKVSLPIKPGQQSINLSWRKTQDQSVLLTTPLINMGISSVNNHIKVLLGRDRWVLFTAGPKFGPAVLIWGVLIVLALCSIALGKVTLTPLKHWQWFLLLLGLSQIPIISALVVVSWLIVLGLRSKKPITEAGYFNASQIGIGLFTVISLLILFFAVEHGLLKSPDMQIIGNQSNAYNLNWYQDRTDELLPTATIISVPLMSYRVLMLLWSLWLAVSLLDWLKWGWSCFSTGGLWKTMHSKKKNTPVI